MHKTGNASDIEYELLVAKHQEAIQTKIKRLQALIVSSASRNNPVLVHQALATTNVLAQIARGLTFYLDWLHDTERLSILQSTNNTLTELDLSVLHLRDEHLTPIAMALTINSKIEMLDLSYNRLSNAASKDIAKFLKVNHQLHTLDLTANDFTSASIKTLTDALRSNTVLTTLILNHNQVTNTGAKHIARLLQSNAQLTRLALNGCQIRDGGVELIAQALDLNTHLRSLSLSSNPISVKGIKQLADTLTQTTTLTELMLSDVKLSHKSLNYLVTALKSNSSLTTLDLSHNALTDSEAPLIATLIQSHPTLLSLDLSFNLFTDKGLSLIQEALLTHSQLQHLGLSNNKLSDKSAKKLAELPEHNTRLVSLDLSGNQIGDEGAKALAFALEYNTLTALNLKDNQITDQGATFFANALGYNSSLQTLSLRDNSISPAGVDALEFPMQAVNTSLLSLDLHNTLIQQPFTEVATLLQELRKDLAGCITEYNPEVINQAFTTLDTLDQNLKRMQLSFNQPTLSPTQQMPYALLFAANQLGESDLEALCQQLKNQSPIMSLAIHDNALPKVLFREFCAQLAANRTLTSLSLHGNRLNVRNIEDLASVLSQHQSLTHVDLSYNPLAEDEMQLLTFTLRFNTMFRAIHLAHNGLNDKNSENIAVILQKNQQLQRLDLSYNALTAVAMRSLAAGLRQNRSLIELDLNHNELSDQGLAELCKALNDHPTLQTLNLSHTKLTPAASQTLITALSSNTTLQNINLEGNNLKESTQIDALLQRNRMFRQQHNEIQMHLQRASNILASGQFDHNLVALNQALDATDIALSLSQDLQRQGYSQALFDTNHLRARIALRVGNPAEALHFYIQLQAAGRPETLEHFSAELAQWIQQNQTDFLTENSHATVLLFLKNSTAQRNLAVDDLILLQLLELACHRDNLSKQGAVTQTLTDALKDLAKQVYDHSHYDNHTSTRTLFFHTNRSIKRMEKILGDTNAFCQRIDTLLEKDPLNPEAIQAEINDYHEKIPRWDTTAHDFLKALQQWQTELSNAPPLDKDR